MCSIFQVRGVIRIIATSITNFLFPIMEGLPHSIQDDEKHHEKDKPQKNWNYKALEQAIHEAFA